MTIVKNIIILMNYMKNFIKLNSSQSSNYKELITQDPLYYKLDIDNGTPVISIYGYLFNTKIYLY